MSYRMSHESIWRFIIENFYEYIVRIREILLPIEEEKDDL